MTEFTEADRTVASDLGETLADELSKAFGVDEVYLDRYAQTGKGLRFPVLTRDEKVEWSTVLSATLRQVPTFTVEYVFVAPEHLDPALKWATQFRERFLKRGKEGSR